MLTTEMTEVDARPPSKPEPPRAVMWSISQIADRDGVSKQAVSKKVARLVDLGLSVERDSAGHVAAVNVVEYDRLRGRTDDPSKVQAPGREPPPTAPADESYNEAIRQKTWHEAEKRRLELDELKGKLMRVDRVADAVVHCGASTAKICDRLPGAADELAAALNREGVHGLRVALKQIASRQRSEIADALAGIAAAAPKEEPEEADAEPALS
jgi:hypothetical protein